MTFSTKLFSDKNRKILVPKNFPTKSVRIFFEEKNSDQKFSDHLFRSQMIPRFRKSYLEQRATIIKLRTASTKKKFRIFPQYCHKTPSIWIEFRGSSVYYYTSSSRCRLRDAVGDGESPVGTWKRKSPERHLHDD